MCIDVCIGEFDCFYYYLLFVVWEVMVGGVQWCFGVFGYFMDVGGIEVMLGQYFYGGYDYVFMWIGVLIVYVVIFVMIVVIVYCN